MGGNDPTSDLWGSLAQEVERLTSGRARGVNFSEDFAVDRVCAAIAKLRQRHERRGTASSGDVSRSRSEQDPSRPRASGGGVEELVSLRVELAMEEQRMRIKQGKLDGARSQIKHAREERDELQEELQSEEAGRRQTSEGQARQWRDAAFRTHLCLANLQAKEQEVSQLQAALQRPAHLAEAWENLVKNLKRGFRRGSKRQARTSTDPLV